MKKWWRCLPSNVVEHLNLSKEHIYMIHEATIPEFGGNPGFYDYTDRRIESILSLQYPVFGYNKYPDLFPKNEYE